MEPPQLTFFCELPADELEALLADPGVIDGLAALGASISLGILDLGPARAGVVRRLHQAAVPVVAWLLLPRAQGYWFNVDNASQAVARYRAFKAWTAREDLSWAGVALDIEPQIHEMQALLRGQWAILPLLARRLCRASDLWRAQATYRGLVHEIQQDGYLVDSYVFPFIADERMIGSTFLQRFLGIVDVPAEREVPMLYSSHLRPLGPGFLWSYGRDADSVGVGISGGGVNVGRFEPLTWDELARDLRLACRCTRDIHIFSLEGCVQRGWLGRLREFDWEQSVAAPVRLVQQVDALRWGLRAGLWASRRPVSMLVAMAGLAWALRCLVSQKDRAQ